MDCFGYLWQALLGRAAVLLPNLFLLFYITGYLNRVIGDKKMDSDFNVCPQILILI